MRFLQRQISDLVGYLLLPGLAVVLPARWSRSLVHRVANWRWMLPEGDAAMVAARAQGQVSDEAGWLRHWRRVELLDARDTFMLRFGRSRSVFAEIRGLDALDTARDMVMVGMHWGPSISILRLLEAHGMTPTLVYRKVDPATKWQRPFRYLHLRVLVSEIERACGGTAIAAGGAKARLKDRLAEPGIVVVLADAPAERGRPVLSGRLLDRPCQFNAGFPRVLMESGRDFVFYAISLSIDGRVMKELDLDGPHPVAGPEAFMDVYSAFLERHLRFDSAQWRIWQAAAQVFQEPETVTQAAKDAAAAG